MDTLNTSYLGINMKIFTVIALFVTAFTAATSAHASKELANKSACMACHAAEKKVLGPAYLEVAKKYAGQKDAVAVLAASIKAGGSGKWGAIPMPAQAALSDADAKTLAAWILGGAK
jgi:cytochrome c